MRTRAAVVAALAAGALLLGPLAPGTHGAFIAQLEQRSGAAITPFLTCGAVTADEVRRSAGRFAFALDEAAGATQAADASGQSRTGTYTGTMTTEPSDVGGCARDGGTAWAPDGTTSGVDVPEVVLPAAFTFEARVRTDRAREVIAAILPTRYPYTFGLVLDEGSIALTSAATGDLLRGSATVADGEWHHIALVVDGPRGISLYVDSQRVAYSGFDMPDGEPAVWHLAYDDASGSLGRPRFAGAMRNALLTARALTADEVRTHDRAGRTVPQRRIGRPRPRPALIGQPAEAESGG